MTDSDLELDRFSGFLQQNTRKLTSERAALLREISETHYHFEADELLVRMKEKGVKISRATIYRTLDLLVRSGMVRRVHLGEDHYHYEYVSADSHHDHLICTTCGDVIEFHDPRLEQRQHEICMARNFTPNFHNLQILGVCRSCQQRGEQPELPDRVRSIGEGALKLRK